jgi:protein-S-isoprenylcysteine O-methyltransferase Ste14
VRSRAASLLGSGLFLLIAPGTVAGYFPWLITRWRFAGDFGAAPVPRAAGAVLILLGGLALLECFWRFAWVGVGTPAPVAPTRQLVTSGLYRHVRNPMYVAVAALTIGQVPSFRQRPPAPLCRLRLAGLPSVRAAVRGAKDATELPRRLCTIHGRGAALAAAPAAVAQRSRLRFRG